MRSMHRSLIGVRRARDELRANLYAPALQELLKAVSDPHPGSPASGATRRVWSAPGRLRPPLPTSAEALVGENRPVAGSSGPQAKAAMWSVMNTRS